MRVNSDSSIEQCIGILVLDVLSADTSRYFVKNERHAKANTSQSILKIKCLSSADMPRGYHFMNSAKRTANPILTGVFRAEKEEVVCLAEVSIGEKKVTTERKNKKKNRVMMGCQVEYI